MIQTKPKQPKALWYRARFGDGPVKRPRKQPRRVSKAMSKKLRLYHAKVAEWKKGRLCACAGLCVDLNRGIYLPVCNSKPHLCDDCHHSKGRGKHLMDETTWVPVCRIAHAFIGNNPKWAESHGLNMSRLARI